MKYRILSPDGVPIIEDNKINTEAKVILCIDRWVRRYERQGYYLTADGERIHYLELPFRLSIVRWGSRGNITQMSVARVGYEQPISKLTKGETANANRSNTEQLS
jgi:hypothetical protein